MKKISLTCILTIQVIGLLLAQKRPLDFSTPSNWPALSWAKISNDGKYAMYTVTVPTKGSHLIAQATDCLWKQELPGGYDGCFTADSHMLVFKTPGDSLGMLTIGTNQVRYISGVSDFKLCDRSPWLIYQSKYPETSLVLFNWVTGIEKQFVNIVANVLSPDGQVLVMKQVIKNGYQPQTKILLVRIGDSKAKTICEIRDASHFTFDKNGKRLVFFSLNATDETELQYYELGMDSTRVIVSPSTPGMWGEILSETAAPFFSTNGQRVFYFIEKRDNAVKDTSSGKKAAANIRSTLDNRTKAGITKRGPILAVTDLNIFPAHVTRLQQDIDEKRPVVLDGDGKWLLTESNIIGNYNDYKWQLSARPNIYLVSTKDGSRRLLKSRLIYSNLSFSLTGKYIIWFDREKKQWFVYNIASHRTKNISNRIKTPVYREDDHPDFSLDEGLAGWMENDEGVIIYDRFDLWQLDPNAVTRGVNITKRYGAKNNIQFRCVNFKEGGLKAVRKNDTLLLSAFDQINKHDGFFFLDLTNNTLTKQILSSYCFTYQEPTYNGVHSTCPVLKSKYGHTYIVSRMSTTEYPNLFVTSNFRDFKPLTNLEPQMVYNWYTSELVHWRLPDGRPAEGIMYKPENFNPHKKYPIIFFYYEKNAFALNVFIHPELSEGPMNIPWFVSNGYLVFVPDIHYKIGYPGQSAYNVIKSAAIYLSQKKWVDAKHMGLQGHSYGGFETNYIVTHTSMFKAAAVAAGISNMTSDYLQAWDWDGTWYFERRQQRLGTTLWENPRLYIENSPIFRADKVTTPMLIMHNKQDAAVPYTQGAEWYAAFRRLGKKAWFLSYERGGHILLDQRDQLDYSVRLGQFFDYYLKGASQPKWMIPE